MLNFLIIRNIITFSCEQKPRLCIQRKVSIPIYTTEKMGPGPLKSGPDQFYLTVYTGSNQVRLVIEKSPKAS